MFDIALRSLKDDLTLPIARLIPSTTTPNHITFLAFVAGLACCYASATSTPENRDAVISPALVLWILNRSFDCLDGALARVRGEASELGGFLDLLCDFIVYAAIPISIGINRSGGLMIGLGGDPGQSIGGMWVAIAFLEATFWINNFILFYAAAVASKVQDGELTSVTMLPALVEGFESGILFTAMLIWPNHIFLLSSVMAVGVSIGSVQRVVWLWPVLARLDRQAKSATSQADGRKAKLK